MSAIEIILISILFLLQLASLILFSLAFARLDYSHRMSRNEMRSLKSRMAGVELDNAFRDLEKIGEILGALDKK